jgi:hypothetical protein
MCGGSNFPGAGADAVRLLLESAQADQTCKQWEAVLILNEPQQWEAASEENFRSLYTSITADGLKAQICRNRNSDRSLFPGNQTSNHETDIPSVCRAPSPANVESC